MTVYELINGIPDNEFDKYIKAGIVSSKWKRYMDIFEYFTERVKNGDGRMQVYLDASDKFFMNEDNIRKVISTMKREVD